MPFPFRLQRRDIDDQGAAPRIGRFTKADYQNVPRYLEILDRAGQHKRMWRDHAHIRLARDKARIRKLLGIDDSVVDVRENLLKSSATRAS